MHRAADPGGNVEVKQLRSGTGEHHVERLDITVDQALVLQFGPLARLGFGQFAGPAFIVQLLEPRRIRMKGDERTEQIEGDIDGFPVAKVLASGDELTEWLPVNEFGDEIPLACAGLAGPEDLHHVGMMDLAQGADLAAYRFIAGGAVEELERPLLALDVLAHAVDLREAALTDHGQNLEAALEDVTDSVGSSLGPSRGSRVCRVRFVALDRGERPGAARATGVRS